MVHRVGCPGGALDPSCAPFFEYDPTLNPAVGYSLLYHANSIYPTSQYSGSPVLYRKVTKYEVDAADNPNGKTVFYYQVYQDGSTISNNGISDPVPSDYNTSGIFLISNTWKNGFPTGEETYKLKNGNYYLETKKSTTYLTANSDNQSVLKIKPWYYSTGCDNVNDAASCALYDVRITTGTMLPITIVESTVDDANNNLSSTQNITYNSDLYPIQRHTVKSNGDDIIENIKYPGDFSASGNVYAKMIARHIISPVIQSQKLVGGTQTLLTKVNYNDWFGDNTLLEPSSVEMQTGSNPSEVRVMFNQYDVMGNIIQQQKTNDAFQTYIWDYNSTYPIAVVKNATQSDVAYTSFEAEGTGNWSGITSNDLQSAPSPTGSNYYTLSPEGLTKDGLSATTTYIVSYWSKNGAYSITGTASVKTGRSITIGGGNWTCYEHLVTGTSSITVTGTGGIDELRLYPATAQMTTYAYTPLIGMITQCDVASRIIYYQYDGLGRLKVVKDQDGNIIKTLNYHYKQ